MKKTFRNFMALAIMAMTFNACEDVPAPYDIFAQEEENNTEVVTGTGSGTLDDPFNVAAAIAKCKEIGTDPSAENYYVKGVVVTGGTADASYGNASFYIGDSEDSGDLFYCFQVLGTGGKKMPAGYAVNKGDEVVVYGPIYNYKGNTPETAGKGAAYIVTINGKSTDDNSGTEQPAGEAKGDGTLANPYNSVAAANLAKSLTTGNSDNVYIKGKVVSIREQFGTQYGNATFYISDDGTEAGQFYVFCTLYLGNKKYESGDLLNVGDEVVIYGKVTNYQGNTPETVQNESYLYSLNGKTASGSGDNPTPQPTGDFGTAESPITVAAALTIINGLGDGKTTDTEAYVKGKITSISEVSTSYGNATYLIADEGSDNALTVFRGYSLDGAKFTSESEIKVGDEVVVKGKLQKYVKDGTVTPEVATGSSIVSLNGQGSDTPTPQPGNKPGVVSGNTITAAMSDFGLDNEADLGTLTLSDGTTLTFAQNEGMNMPKYYTVDASARLYALSSVEVKAGKNIQRVVLNCVSGRTGNETLTATASNGTVTISKTDTSLTFDGFSSATLRVVNDHTGNSGGTQVRIVSIEITYAE